MTNAPALAPQRQRLNLPQLRPDQFEIAASPARIKVVACGRRWGKSLTARTMGFMIASAGGRVAWVVPTYKNSKSTWREAELIGVSLKQSGVIINRTEKVIEFPNGGFLGIYSADNADSLRGDSFHLVVLDEAAFMDEVVFREVALPLIGDTGGTIMAIGTPHGRGWFWSLYQNGLPGPNQDPDIRSWQAPTMNNPMPEIERFVRIARRNMPEESFRQEILAEFMDVGGSVFKNVDAVCVNKPFTGPLPGRAYICGVDLAKMKDYTVFSVLDAHTGHQVFMQRLQRIDYLDQVKELAKLHRLWHFSTIVVEQNNIGEVFIEQCKPFGMPIERFMTDNTKKGEIILSLAVAFENMTIRLLNDGIQREEFKIFEQTMTPSGLPKYGAPPRKHDDTVMATAIAYSKVHTRTSTAIGWWDGTL